VLCGRQAETFECLRALNGEERVIVGDIAHVGSRHLPFLQPAEISVTIGRVDDQQVAELIQPVGDQVVDDPAPLVGQQRVLSLPRLDPIDVIRERRLQQLGGARTFDFELAHVGDVENAAVIAHGLVLADDTRVLHRHLPAGERNHARTERNVTVVERRSQQRLGHRERC
jgi:hypothetical protein